MRIADPLPLSHGRRRGDGPRGRIRQRLAAAGVVALLASAPAGIAAAGEDPPVAAPGSSVPKHAQGGWPTSLTDADQKPQRTPEQQAHLDAVTAELKRIAETSGPDAVVLQSKLLLRCMAAGAAGASEVRVAGPSARHPGFLEIDVTTGILFAAESTSPEARRDLVWKDVAAPVLDEMKSFRIEPAGLELVLAYAVQDRAQRGGAEAVDAAREASAETLRVRLDQPLLAALVDDSVDGVAALGRADSER